MQNFNTCQEKSFWNILISGGTSPLVSRLGDASPSPPLSTPIPAQSVSVPPLDIFHICSGPTPWPSVPVPPGYYPVSPALTLGSVCSVTTPRILWTRHPSVQVSLPVPSVLVLSVPVLLPGPVCPRPIPRFPFTLFFSFFTFQF